MTPTTDTVPEPWLVDADEVVRSLASDAVRGLEPDEAARRLAADGPNVLASAPPVPVWRKVLVQFQDPLIYLLLGAVVVSVAAWAVEGAAGWPVDAVVIAVIVVLNAVLGYVQEARAENAVAALARMTAATATVQRGGEQVRVPTDEVVVGDVLVLAEGDAVAADARLLSAAALTVAEASLTGESEAVLKTAQTLPRPAALGDRVDMVFSGTAVTQGSGRAVVTATGMRTEMGRIAELLERTPEDPSPLQREVARVGRMLGIAVVVIALVVMVTVVLTAGVDDVDDAVTVLLLGVSLAVAAVPEGLPAVLSVVLAIGVQRLARHDAVVKRLASVETLGSASVIGSDKTGTLTRNEMTIQRVVTASGETSVTGVGYQPEGAVLHDGVPLTRETGGRLWVENVLTLSGGSLANDAVLREEDGSWVVQGDPTEAAFLVAERKLGSAEVRADRFRRIGEVPFTSERKLMSTLESDSRHGVHAVVTKGAPDVLLSRCSHVRVGDDVVPLDDAYRARVLADVDRLSAEAFRTLAVAYRVLEAAPEEVDESLERELVLVGVVGIIDPPRTTAARAIAEAHRAGIRVLMITGDHPLTAARIAADLGIVGPGTRVLTGNELDELSDDELRVAVRDTDVYARVAPQHKLAVVDALQAGGEIVAMTGDGVNDAPALKSAHIGIAMGRTGTEVTKESARMVLADDDFATIVTAVRQGRAIFDNIRKFLRFLLSSNMGEVLTVFLGVVGAGVIGLGGGDEMVLPLLATQILWINLLTDTGPALAMGVDPETEDVMARRPRGVDERVIDGRMWRGVLLVGLVMALVTLLAIDLNLPGGIVEGHHDLTTARTAGFTVLVLAQLFNTLNARSETVSALSHPLVNPWLWGAIGLSLALQVVVVHTPVGHEAFGTASLGPWQWLQCLALASVVLWAEEARKLLARVRQRRAVVQA